MARAVLLVVALLAGGCGARPARVWTAAQEVLPRGMTQLVYVDLAALRPSDPSGWLLARVGQRLGLGEDAAARVLAGCGIDLGTAKVLFAARGRRDGAIFVHIPGVGRDRLLPCLERELQIRPIPQGDDYTWLEGVAYLAWVRRDVFAIAFDRTDKDALASFVGGKGDLFADRALAEVFVDVDEGADMWGVITSGSDVRRAVAFNVHRDGAAGSAVRAVVHLHAGGWARAWMMARMLRRKTRAIADDVQAITIDAEASRVVVRVWMTERQAREAAEELLGR